LTVFLFAETTIASTTGRSLSSQSGETTASSLSTVTSESSSLASTSGSSQGALTTGTPSASSGSSQGALTTGTSSATSGSNQGTLSSGTPSVTTGSSQGTLTTGTPPATTTKTCEVMQAVDESISKQITVTPVELPNGTNIEFQPTSTSGVSFPKGDETPTITVNFGKPTEVHSVTIPRDKTPNANVQQFEVTFYSPNGKKVNDKPIVTNLSPTDDKTKPAQLDSTQIPSNIPVSRIDITIVHTTDNETPKGVVLNIIACTEITTG
jgi:hypothetical protein